MRISASRPCPPWAPSRRRRRPTARGGHRRPPRRPSATAAVMSATVGQSARASGRGSSSQPLLEEGSATARCRRGRPGSCRAGSPGCRRRATRRRRVPRDAAVEHGVRAVLPDREHGEHVGVGQGLAGVDEARAGRPGRPGRERATWRAQVAVELARAGEGEPAAGCSAASSAKASSRSVEPLLGGEPSEREDPQPGPRAGGWSGRVDAVGDHRDLLRAAPLVRHRARRSRRTTAIDRVEPAQPHAVDQRHRRPTWPQRPW